jgi:hypothetical protein
MAAHLLVEEISFFAPETQSRVARPRRILFFEV